MPTFNIKKYKTRAKFGQKDIWFQCGEQQGSNIVECSLLQLRILTAIVVFREFLVKVLRQSQISCMQDTKHKIAIDIVCGFGQLECIRLALLHGDCSSYYIAQIYGVKRILTGTFMELTCGVLIKLHINVINTHTYSHTYIYLHICVCGGGYVCLLLGIIINFPEENFIFS